MPPSGKIAAQRLPGGHARPRRARARTRRRPTMPPARIASRSASRRQPTTQSRSETRIELVELGIRRERASRPRRRSPGSRRRAAHAAEQRAADRVDGDEPRARLVLAQVVAAAAQGSRRARGDEQVVELAVERLVDLAHRARRVGGRVRLVRVLVGPERVGDLGEQPRTSVQPGDEQIAGLGIGLRRRPARRRRARASRARSSRARGRRRRRSAAARGSGRPARARSPCCPSVDSITVVPRSIEAAASASSIIRAAGRSFALPPGFAASSFAQTSTSGRSSKRRSATSGVSPIAPRMPSTGARTGAAQRR